MKRGYLLPEGCKDLIDVLNLNLQPKSELLPIFKMPKMSKSTPAVPPSPLSIRGEIAVPDIMSASDLAIALKQKPFRIIADLMELGVFTNANNQLPFDIIAKVAQKYGYIAKKAP